MLMLAKARIPGYKKPPCNMPHAQRGVGLVELMIGIVVGLIILSGTISLYINALKNSSSTLLATKFNQEFATSMSLMVADIRRAGYWANANTGGDNPFTVTASPATDIHILDANSCVMFSYDLNADGGVNNEFFGFKYADSDGDGSNDSILMLSGGATSTNDCNSGDWVELVDSRIIQIDTLSFSSTGSKCLNTAQQWIVTSDPSASNACSDNSAAGYSAPNTGDVLLESRQVTIRLSGHLRNDPSVTKSLQETVNIRNDRIVQM